MRLSAEISSNMPSVESMMSTGYSNFSSPLRCSQSTDSRIDTIAPMSVSAFMKRENPSSI